MASSPNNGLPAIGFEMQNRAPSGDQLYPSLDVESGPTPVESAKPETVSTGGVGPIGFEDLGSSGGTEDGPSTGEGVALLGPDGKQAPGVKGSADIPASIDVVHDEEKQERESRTETLFFQDGKRRIDFILSFKDLNDVVQQGYRECFEKSLVEQGLELEYEDKKESQDGQTSFIKIHGPFDVLSRMAEILQLKMPIKEYDIGDENDGCLPHFKNPLVIGEDLLPPQTDYFTADFSRDRADMFVIKDKDTFFSIAQRSLCIHELLLRTVYCKDDKNKLGIDKLVRCGVYTSAFPLHEGKYSSPHSILTEGINNSRHLLFETWARPGRWYFYQPLDEIRSYFGEKIGIYFAWLGFYTAMLIPASIVGVIVFIYGCATVMSNAPSDEICDENDAGGFIMCPLCDKRCTYWRLHTSCMYSRFTYLFDNGATVFFACFMAIWATMFLEFWKRKQGTLQYDWDVAGFEHEERMRPDFEARCNQHQKLNPITQLMEPFLPFWKKVPRKVTSLSVVLMLIFCVCAAIFGVIMYRIVIVAVLYASGDELIQRSAKITTTCTAACISLVVIMILNRIYLKIALWLTEFERPRTDSEYEDGFTFKMFLFQFINYYGTIFYIAFFKGRLGGRPGNYDYRMGFRAEECDPAGCLIELCIQLAIIMVGKQALNNFKEIMLPKILNIWRAYRARKKETKENLYTRWEQDYDLQCVPDLGLFDEYLEMVIQYGFVTIFVAAFPLAPLCALLNNVIEIRLDAYKFVTQWRRPVANRAQDIGIWLGILQGVTFIAVLSNAFIIGWTSDFVPKLVYRMDHSLDNSLSGYINHSLSYFDVNDFQNQSIPDDPMTSEFGNVTHCRYSDYRYPPGHEDKYDYTREYWHVFSARIIFIIVFEHVVFFLTWLVAYLIPDMPGEVKQLMLREMHLAKEARYSSAFSTLEEERQDEKDKTV